MVTTRRGGAAATPPPLTPGDIAAAAAAEATRRNNAIKPFQFGGADAKLRGVAARPVDNSGGVRLKDQCLETYDNDGTSWRTSDKRLTLLSNHAEALRGQRNMSIEELERAPLPAGMPAFMDACVLPILPDEDPAATPEQMAFAYELTIRSSPAGRCDTVRETHSDS